MDEVEFTIEFSYKNKEYSGIVRPGEEDNISYVVQYLLEPSKEIEKTIEICIFSEEDEIDNIQWKGDLVLLKKDGSPGYSNYYRDKLIAAIGSKSKIDVNIEQNTNGASYGPDGKTVVENKVGENQDIDKNFGGGVTFGDKGTNQIVRISGHELNGLKDTKGAALSDKPADILAHELVGHAIPHIIGSDTGNAVSNENKVRSELGKDHDQQREPEPSHTE